MQGMIQAMFSAIESKFPNDRQLIQNIKNQAINLAQQHGNPGAVINGLKTMTAQTPYADRINDPEADRILNSFANQAPTNESMFNHAKKVAANMGVLPMLMGKFGSMMFGGRK